MSSPFLYFADERLSAAELSAARLDGDLVEIGEGYMPTDAVETRELRAGSLRTRIPATLALTRASAAWIHGAVADPPPRHIVQRTAPRRGNYVRDLRLDYRDQRIAPADVQWITGVAVTTPARTLADLVRDLHAGEATLPLIDAMLAWRPELRGGDGRCAGCGRRPPLQATGGALPAGASQDDVTRYTS
ncbi:hypothetical protein [Pseudoxanthomonas mexicana]